MTRKITLIMAVFTSLFLLAVPAAMAVPMLQLDIEGAYYDYGTETLVTDLTQFNVDALLTAKNDEGAAVDPTATYFLSIAMIPKTSTAGDYGSFTIDGGSPVMVTDDMTYGTPPPSPSDPDLQRHGVFPTYYIEIPFTFDGTTTPTYNTQDAAQDGFKTLTGGDSYINSWAIDGDGLDDVNLHFDLYTVIDGKLFKAPFSHDAETRVPEPGTLVLLGIGMLGVAVFRKKLA